MSQPSFNRILITGASSGIGAEVARQLSGSHALYLTGKSGDKLDTVLADTDAAGCGADLTAPGEAARIVERAIDELGGLDAVVHAAGVGLIKPMLETTDAEFISVTNLNLRATFLIAQAACAHMAEQRKGRFLAIPGILGRAPMKNASAYVASKYGTTGLLKSLALELQRSGVQICLFHFGGVDTPFWDELAMKVQRDKMIPVETAAAQIVAALHAPDHLVMNEVILQPETHQML